MIFTFENPSVTQKINRIYDFDIVSADKVKIEILNNKIISATYNKDNKSNLFVTVFAGASVPSDTFIEIVISQSSRTTFILSNFSHPSNFQPGAKIRAMLHSLRP